MAEIKNTEMIRDALGSPIPQKWDEESQTFIASTVDGSAANMDFSKTKMIRDRLGSPIPQKWDNDAGKFVPSAGGVDGEVTIESIPGLQTKLNETTVKLADKASKSEVRKDTGSQPIDVDEMNTRTKQLFTGGSVAVVAENAVGNENVKEKAISSNKTSFFAKSRNFFSGNYLNWSFLSDASGWYLQDTTSGFNGSLAVVEITPNTEYTIKIHEPEKSNRLRIGTSAVYPTFTNKKFSLNTPINTNDALKQLTFTSGATDAYLFVYVSNESKKPIMQIERGNVATPYIGPLVIPKKEIDDQIFKDLKDEIATNQNMVTVLEDPLNGYATRPNSLSVIWIGKNEPTEVEPYDEWRQVEGFTYFTSFDEYLAEQKPSDWTAKWATPNFNKVVVNESDKRLLFQSFNALCVTTWGKVGNTEDSEVYLEGYVGNTISSSGSYLSAVHRGSGEEGSEKGYLMGIRSLDGNAGAGIARVLNGTSRTIGFKPKPEIDFTKPYRQVTRVDGTQLRIKVWQVGQPEPVEWDIDMFDLEPIVGTGFNGIYTFLNSSTCYINNFGVGTGSMRSPRRKLIQ